VRVERRHGPAYELGRGTGICPRRRRVPPPFQSPAGFPDLARVQISIGSGSNPRLNLQGYLALTSNTAQIGARLELYAAKAGFNIYGFLGFDALFIFSPFSFEVEIGAGIALRRGSSRIMAVHLRFILSGPAPWRARGSASFEILFITIRIRFDVTIGREKAPELPDVNPWPLLEAALLDIRNWSAELPEEKSLMVTLRKLGTETSLMVHPMGFFRCARRYFLFIIN